MRFRPIIICRFRKKICTIQEAEAAASNKKTIRKCGWFFIFYQNTSELRCLSWLLHPKLPLFKISPPSMTCPFACISVYSRMVKSLSNIFRTRSNGITVKARSKISLMAENVSACVRNIVPPKKISKSCTAETKSMTRIKLLFFLRFAKRLIRCVRA